MTQSQNMAEALARLDRWLCTFLLDAQVAGRSQATIEFYEQKLRPFLAYLDSQQITVPEQIAADHVRGFLAGLAPAQTQGGVHAYWRALRAYIRFLVREGVIIQTPLLRMRAPHVDERPLDPVSESVVQALLSTCDRSVLGLRDRALLLTLLDTGLRAGELLALNLDDLDTAEGRVTVRRSKNGHPRTVFVGRQTNRALAAWLRQRPILPGQEALWLAYHSDGTHTRLRYDGLRDMLKRRAARAGVESPSLHSFRRAFAVSMLRSGADVVSISRLMGHGSLPVLQRYLRQLPDDLRLVHAAHSPVDRLVR